MIEIVLVRHAQPDWEPGGHAVEDPDLTDLGRAQAARIAEALAVERFDAFYCSPLLRALQTARPLADHLGMEPHTCAWLEELRLPSLAGQPVEQVHHFLAQARRRDLHEWWDGLPGGETFRDFHERLVRGIRPLLEEGHQATSRSQGAYPIWQIPEESQKFLVVAHAGTIAVLLSHLLDIEPVPWEWERFRLGWAGIVRIRTQPIAGGAIWSLLRFNTRDHLAGLPDPEG